MVDHFALLFFFFNSAFCKAVPLMKFALEEQSLTVPDA
uniref:Uncharacterized protein n=1 Tax=Arundo donax TaxID=35708 RepID=A0A0A9HEM5_ARUDO